MEKHILEQYIDAQDEERDLVRRIQSVSDKLLNMEMSGYETIEDSRIRRIMRYRYIDDLNWVQVAHRMGKNHTAESCRKAHDRFLEEK